MSNRPCPASRTQGWLPSRFSTSSQQGSGRPEPSLSSYAERWDAPSPQEAPKRETRVKRGHLVAVVGLKGGVGRTTVSAALARAILEDPELLEDAVTPYDPYDAVSAEGDGYASVVSTDRSDLHPLFADGPPADPVHVAALTTVASVIMNLDGFLTKD